MSRPDVTSSNEGSVVESIQFGNIVPGAYKPVLAKQVPVIRSAAKATLFRRRSLLALQFGEGLRLPG